MNIPILYEDNNLIVFDKPPFLVVNRAESVKVDTLADYVEKRYPDIFRIQNFPDGGTSDFLNRSGIVHRIDKETSGAIIVAKDHQSFAGLQAQFKNRIIRKKYLAVAHGSVKPDTGEINAPIGRLPWNRERFGVIPDGKEAQTFYKLIFNFEKEGNEYSLLILSPHTGRTHQIRVHLRYINHPIVGDNFYAGRKKSKSDRQSVPRTLLHAYEVTFLHPESNTETTVKSPMPKDMQNFIPLNYHGLVHEFEI